MSNYCCNCGRELPSNEFHAFYLGPQKYMECVKCHDDNRIAQDIERSDDGYDAAWEASEVQRRLK